MWEHIIEKYLKRKVNRLCHSCASKQRVHTAFLTNTWAYNTVDGLLHMWGPQYCLWPTTIPSVQLLGGSSLISSPFIVSRIPSISKSLFFYFYSHPKMVLLFYFILFYFYLPFSIFLFIGITAGLCSILISSYVSRAFRFM